VAHSLTTLSIAPNRRHTATFLGRHLNHTTALQLQLQYTGEAGFASVYFVLLKKLSLHTEYIQQLEVSLYARASRQAGKRPSLLFPSKFRRTTDRSSHPPTTRNSRCQSSPFKPASLLLPQLPVCRLVVKKSSITKFYNKSSITLFKKRSTLLFRLRVHIHVTEPY
jgi:hypothetical protein